MGANLSFLGSRVEDLPRVAALGIAMAGLSALAVSLFPPTIDMASRRH
jgi:hypothetical protein